MAIKNVSVQVQAEHLREAVERLYAMVRPKGQPYELEFNMGWTTGGSHVMLKASNVDGTSGHWIGVQMAVPIIGNAAEDVQVGFYAKLKGSRANPGYVDLMEQQPVHISVAHTDGPSAKVTFAQPAASNQDLHIEKVQVTGAPLLRVEAGDMITTTVGDLLDCLESVVPYAGLDNSREALHNVQIVAFESYAHATAADGYILGTAQLPLIDHQGEKFVRVVSAHALKGVCKALSDYCRGDPATRRDDVVILTFDHSALSISYADKLILIELRNSPFPDTSNIHPKSRTWTSVTLSTAELDIVLKQVKTTVKADGERWVGLYLGKQAAIMAPQETGQSWHGLTPRLVLYGREKCPQPFAAVSLNRLKTIVKTFQRAAEVKIIIRGPQNVLVFEAVEDDSSSVTGLLMPMVFQNKSTEHTEALSAGPKGLPSTAPTQSEPAAATPAASPSPTAPPSTGIQPSGVGARAKTCTWFANWIRKLSRQHGLDLDTCEMGEELVLQMPPYKDLFIQRYAYNLVRVAHESYLNGDVMYDPCIMFFTGYQGNKWVPMDITNHTWPTDSQFRVYVELTDDGTRIKNLNLNNQHDLAKFVNGLWFSNLKGQGWMDNATPKRDEPDTSPEPSAPTASAPQPAPVMAALSVEGQAQGFTAFTPHESWGDREDPYGQFLWQIYDLVTEAAPLMRTSQALPRAWADPNAPYEILGELVGKFTAWSAEHIFLAFMNALEDANWHSHAALLQAALDDQDVWDLLKNLADFIRYNGDVDRRQLRQALDGLLANPSGQPLPAPPAENNDEFMDPALVDELLGHVAGGNGQAVVATAPVAAPAIAPASAISETIIWPTTVGQVCPFQQKATGKAIKAILRQAGFKHGQWATGTDGIGYTPFTNGVTTIHVRSGRHTRAIVLVDGPPFNPAG